MIYIDERGWAFKVMPSLAESTYKARYNKEGAEAVAGWKTVKVLPFRSTAAEAEEDLKLYAKNHGMRPYGDKDLEFIPPREDGGCPS